MVEIKKILYPTDYSEFSLAALPLAIDMTRRYGAELHCLHVLDIDHEFFAEGGYIAPLAVKAPVPVDKLQKSAEEQMSKMVQKHLAPAEDSVVRKVVQGKPFIEIIQYARDQKIDLIVMGTHGHSALGSMLMGSVAEKVVHKAPCAVLTVKHPKHKFVAP